MKNIKVDIICIYLFVINDNFIQINKNIKISVLINIKLKIDKSEI